MRLKIKFWIFQKFSDFTEIFGFSLTLIVLFSHVLFECVSSFWMRFSIFSMCFLNAFWLEKAGKSKRGQCGGRRIQKGAKRIQNVWLRIQSERNAIKMSGRIQSEQKRIQNEQNVQNLKWRIQNEKLMLMFFLTQSKWQWRNQSDNLERQWKNLSKKNKKSFLRLNKETILRLTASMKWPMPKVL